MIMIIDDRHPLSMSMIQRPTRIRLQQKIIVYKNSFHNIVLLIDYPVFGYEPELFFL